MNQKASVFLPIAFFSAAFILICLSFPKGLVASKVDEQECLSRYRPFPVFFNQTISSCSYKRPKQFDLQWKPSRRRGPARIATTFFNVHSLEAVPVFGNRLPPQPVLDELFKCRGFGEKKSVDIKLVETIVAAAKNYRSIRVNIYSAYRSEKFNDSLAKRGKRVATESKHTLGKAIDFSLPSVHASVLGAWLIENFDGGVGIYNNDNFVHIDSGPKRRWFGR